MNFIEGSQECDRLGMYIPKDHGVSMTNIDLCARPPVVTTLFTFKAKRKGNLSVNKTHQQIDASTLQ